MATILKPYSLASPHSFSNIASSANAFKFVWSTIPAISSALNFIFLIPPFCLLLYSFVYACILSYFLSKYNNKQNQIQPSKSFKCIQYINIEAFKNKSNNESKKRLDKMLTKSTLSDIVKM